MTKNELVRTYLEKAAKRRQKSKPRIRPSPDKSGSHEGNGIRSRGSPAAPGESLDTGSREEGGTRTVVGARLRRARASTRAPAREMVPASRGSPAAPGDSLDTGSREGDGTRSRGSPAVPGDSLDTGSREGDGTRSCGSPAAPGESLDTGSREGDGTRSRGSPAVPGDSLDTQPSPDGGSGLLSSRRMMSSLAINRAPTREMVSAVVGARLCRAMTVATESCSYA